MDRQERATMRVIVEDNRRNVVLDLRSLRLPPSTSEQDMTTGSLSAFQSNMWNLITEVSEHQATSSLTAFS
jgi:hypothetical protein